MRSAIRAGARRKRVGGSVLTGSLLADFITDLAENLNELAESGDALVETIAAKLGARVYENYTHHAQDVPLPTSTQRRLRGTLGRLTGDSLNVFDDECIGDPGDVHNRKHRSTLEVRRAYFTPKE